MKVDKLCCHILAEANWCYPDFCEVVIVGLGVVMYVYCTISWERREGLRDLMVKTSMGLVLRRKGTRCDCFGIYYFDHHWEMYSRGEREGDA